MKCDNEAAIVALKEVVKRERDQYIYLTDSLDYDYMGNGEVEKQIQDVQGQIITINLNLEANIGRFRLLARYCCSHFDMVFACP